MGMHKSSLFAALIFILSACNFSEEKDGGDREPRLHLGPSYISFAAIERIMIAPHCIQCHTGSDAFAGVDLTTFASVSAGTTPAGDKLVVPGTPEESALYRVVATGLMPPSGAKPGPNVVEDLRLWIAAGAQEYPKDYDDVN